MEADDDGVNEPSGNREVGELMSEIVELVSQDDMPSLRHAERRVAELHFSVSRELVKKYNPAHEAGFVDIISTLSKRFSDKREPARLFGVAVSTFYRWKSGTSVPHALVRATVKNTILDYLGRNEVGESATGLGVTVNPEPRVARTRSH